MGRALLGFDVTLRKALFFNSLTEEPNDLFQWDEPGSWRDKSRQASCDTAYMQGREG